MAMEMISVVYEHVQVNSMLHHLNVWFLPFRWGINTYRGCEHNCIYCNARYTHEFLKLSRDEFSCRIVVKDNAADVLDREFSREKWQKRLTVNLSTVTDPYQPAEKEFGITRSVLEAFLKHHNALMLTTKSDLVLRDIDLLSEIARTGFLNVVLTLPTIDEGLREAIEPRAPSVEKRLDAVARLHEAGITVGVAAIPLLPHISDGEGQLEGLIKSVAEAGADYVIADMLNFREEAGAKFLTFLEGYLHKLIPRYRELYATDYCYKEYSKGVRKIANRIIKKHKVDNYDKMLSYRKSRSG
jgi:DNA repair photolyase